MALLHRIRTAKMDSDESSIRGYDIQYILQCVSRVDEHLKRKESRRRASSKYIKIKEWLVQEQYLISFIVHTVFRYSKQKMPLFCLDSNIRGLIKGILLLVAGKRFVGETSAQAIRVKNNVRVFFIKRRNPFAVKMLISQYRSLENMKTEIDVRSRLAAYGTVNVPEILMSDLSFDPPFFQEEIVWGEKPFPNKDDNLIADVLCPRIWSIYERHGIKFKRLTEIFDSEVYLKKFARSLDTIPWHDGYGDKGVLVRKAEALLRSNGLLPSSFCHGDLCLGNIILTPANEVYVVDWEQAEEKPLVFDLYEILTEFPNSRIYIESRIKDLNTRREDAEIMPFNEQVCLAALTRIKKSCDTYYDVSPARIPGVERRLKGTIKYIGDLLSESYRRCEEKEY